MAKLIYVTNMSLDGYIEDESGDFNWSEPDEGLFAFFTDLIRSVGTFIYGRRLYETMAVWETDPTLGTQSELMGDFATAWKAADKLVYSTTLTSPPTARTRIERNFDPIAVRELKDAADGDILVGGAELASQAIKAGLVDECRLVVHPVIAGGGKPALATGARSDLELIDERRFDSGAVLLRYRVLGR